MYKVIDSSNSVHWIQAEEYHYEPATIAIISFTRDGHKVASFTNPISIELVECKEDKKEAPKEIQYIPSPVYYPTYTTPVSRPYYPNTFEITWGGTNQGVKYY